MESFEHKLQKFDPGVVWLDRTNRVTALNSVAAGVLGVTVGDAVGTEILQLHPEKSRDKVHWLLESAGCPVTSPPPMTMMINVPDRVLLIKVSKMFDGNEPLGTCMIFFDLTEVTTNPPGPLDDSDRLRQLFKLPVYSRNRVVLLDLTTVSHFKADGHYTTVYTENEHYLCNLSLSDLEERLDGTRFVRVHRSYMINVHYATAFEKLDEQCTVVMSTDPAEHVPVSRSNLQKLKLMFGLA
ncbi:MAG TPA: LytTR family transcriptional regulator DNA-binding domain-containing protein [Gammaproteobacteria bacterium]|nr:LytTR family transcriptional regulator DNA-binding domain-containing protein [Gammaproteobacteria bacterium]